MREIRLLRSTWRGLETESRLGLHGHEQGNLGYGQDLRLMDHRASPRPYQASVRMGRRFCAIVRSRTSLNLGIGRLYHRRMGIDGEGENLNDFNMDEY